MINKILNFFKFKSKPKNKSENEKVYERKIGFEFELESLRKKLNDFLLTTKVQSGIVIERKNYTLIKNGNALFKLEGKEKSGSTYSILISTGNFISRNGEKLSGLIAVNEASLNRALLSDYSSLEKFLDKFPDLKLTNNSLEALNLNDNKFNWKKILEWEIFWQEQVFLFLRPNTIAVLLVILDDSFKKLFLLVATKKQRQIVNDELFYLNQGVNSLESNPNSLNYDLKEFDFAKEKFENVVQNIKIRMNSKIVSNRN